jgi:hypothetical protein
MTQTRKNFFARTVSLTGGAAVTLASLMLANGWSSTDSWEGTQAVLRPASATLYIGDDEDVRDAAGVGVYQGYSVASGVAQELSQMRDGAGLIDPNKIYVYSVGTQNIAILFDAA